MNTEDYSDSQLKKYADDLSKLYNSEKLKREELEESRLQLTKYAGDLKKTLSELKAAYLDLDGAYLDTINRLVMAAEYKDEDTGDHIVRISRYSTLLAEKCGMSEDEVRDIRYASPMHDIGKIGIPDSILLKPSKLSDEEFETMKTHTSIGAKILTGSKASVLQVAQQVAISHHEKWNGKGYPQGIMGDKIPLSGRIVGLVDVFDALTSRRPYKDPYPVEVACEIIEKDSGSHFDPSVAKLFLENIEAVKEIKVEVGNMYDVSLDDFKWSERDMEGHVREDK